MVGWIEAWGRYVPNVTASGRGDAQPERSTPSPVVPSACSSELTDAVANMALSVIL
jgi:hypothetical protein